MPNASGLGHNRRVMPRQHLAGRYRLLDPLGEGGMSVVWRANDEILRRDVAVKVLRSDQARDPAARAIVLAEAQAAASVAHPNVANVFDYGEWVSPDGTTVPYVVMELLTGPTLAQRLHAGPLDPQVAVRIATEIAAGLAAAHDMGLVHRDVKPGNIILAPTGAKIVDFGIAAVAGDPDGVDPDGRVIGTLPFLPPERLRPGVAVPAADIYAWGVLLSHMLIGRPPWPADATPAQRADHVRQADPLPAVPAEVDSLFRRCLEPDPGRRPTAHEVASVLSAAAGIRLAPDLLPAGALARATADQVTAHLTPRLPPHERNGLSDGRTDTATYPVPWPTRTRRIRRIASVAVPVAIAAVLLAVVVLRDGPTGAGPAAVEPSTGAGSIPSTTARQTTPSQTKAASGDTRLTSAGGSVVASCDAGVVLVRTASPATGFELHDGIPGPGSNVEVRFRNDSADVRMIIRCVNNVPVYTLKS
jgi:serine/threonine-protein kinase